MNDEHKILLIDLSTGETMMADKMQLRSRGMPGNYRVADLVITAEWIEALRKALGKD
jgi:hypothetical protein